MVSDAALAYGPLTQFFLACGPMTDAYCDEVLEVITRVRNQGVQAHFLDQRQLMTQPCCSHPSAHDDAVMARKGAAKIAATMDWTLVAGVSIPPVRLALSSSLRIGCAVMVAVLGMGLLVFLWKRAIGIVANTKGSDRENTDI